MAVRFLQEEELDGMQLLSRREDADAERMKR